MSTLPLGRALTLLVLLWATTYVGFAADSAAWLQWGGPRRNFIVDAPPLTTNWPSGGPRQVWRRSLGEGHSAIVADGPRVYTMYRPLGVMSLIRRSQYETVVAMNTSTGNTEWEYTYDAPTGGLDLEYGAGPHSTPLIIGDRLYAVSSLKQIFALDKQTGKVVWSHDMMKEFGAPRPDRGYAPSPIQYKNAIIVPAGGPNQALIAFDRQSGAVLWKNGSYEIAPASPILINADGQEQLVVFGANEVLGVNPADGATLWSHSHRTQYGLNIATPVWLPGHRLLISSAYNNGTRLLQLSRASGKWSAQEVWFQNRMRVHFGTIIPFSDFAIGSSGDFGPCPTVAIDLATGSVLWQSRDFARANFVYADNKLIVVDEDGNLGMATASRQGLTVIAKAPVLSGKAWTAPTLVGTRLYVRDRKSILALELSN
ncbi:MAG TPA: PQQ-binding-like beta-propeller repeat protein [Vicinamibacterales bacterium]|nr:PQQ-binding-like beta-propeller repeat protein [Vicinamibacterales bacterium]